MQHVLQFLTVLMVLFLAPGCGFADSPASAKSIRTYSQLIGLDEVLERMPDQFDATIAQYPSTDEDSRRKRQVARIAKRAWDTRGQKKRVIQYFYAHTTQEQMAQLIEWYNTPLAQKFVEASLEPYHPRFEKSFIRYLKKLESDPLDPERVKVINRVVEASRMSEMMLDSAVEMLRAMMGAFRQFSTKDHPAHHQDLEKEIRAMRAQFGPMMEEQALGMAIYLFRNMTIEDLDQYVQFYDSDLGAFELEMNKGAILHAMTFWGETMMKEVVEILERENA